MRIRLLHQWARLRFAQLPAGLGILLGAFVLCSQPDLHGATRRPYGGVLKVPVTGVVDTLPPGLL